MAIFAKKTLNYIQKKLEFLLLPNIVLYKLMAYKIKKFRPKDIDDLLNFSFNSFAGLIKPIQIREEIKELLKILDKAKPKVILEIGTANGGTLFLLSRVASRNATLISVDLPAGKFGGGYPSWKIPLYKSFAVSDQKIYLFREDSHKKSTKDMIESILDEKKIDFLFIDGDHTYEGVKKDFKMYSPLVKDGRIIAFHDIVSGPQNLVGGVPQFWQEIKKKYKYLEIVEDWNQRGYGIGVIYKNSIKDQ
jgi:predicted O-methyltransferase YrrM